jgi:prolipoprotein diacylglyceryltransferase
MSVAHERVDGMNSLNRFLDTLPRTRLGCGGREVPAFRTCGVAGFYGAVIINLGGGLLAGRSLLVLAGLALVCALSFFAYTYLRKWVTGRETLVLLEHVWFALACSTLALWALDEPVLPYVDVVSVALCVFLAAGRVGCTLVGCCHGRPSAVGITYDDHCARDGFARHLVGVRLFPVPALEAVGLVAIGLTGLVALPFAQPGKVFVWFLLSYSVLRFGLEGLRGDPRPHFLGLSQARWMSLVEVAGALWWLEGGSLSAARACVFGALLAALAGALALRHRLDPRPRLLARPHVGELRELVRSEIVSGNVPDSPAGKATSCGVTVAVSTSGHGFPDAMHVSLALPGDHCDLVLLCELAVRAFPELLPADACFTAGRVLHLLLPVPLGAADPEAAPPEERSQALYGNVVWRLQRDGEPEEERPAAIGRAPGPAARKPWYFTAAGGR